MRIDTLDKPAVLAVLLQDPEAVVAGSSFHSQAIAGLTGSQVFPIGHELEAIGVVAADGELRVVHLGG